MTINRKPFFDAVRHMPFSGTLDQSQVDGMNAILNAWEAQYSAMDQRWLAYCLATAFHETSATMQPIQEFGIGNGHAYGVPDPITRQAYYGRGLVQLTWKANYQKMTALLGVNLVDTPALALRPDIASQIMFRGMMDGDFTGRKLGDYFHDAVDDPVNARRIINRLNKASLVAGYYAAFRAALTAAYAAVAK